MSNEAKLAIKKLKEWKKVGLIKADELERMIGRIIEKERKNGSS